jgi:hypothetical protein
MTSLVSITSNTVLDNLPHELLDEIIKQSQSFPFQAKLFLNRLCCADIKWFLDFYKRYNVNIHPYIYIHHYMLEYNNLTEEERESEETTALDKLQKILRIENNQELSDFYKLNDIKYDYSAYFELFHDYLVHFNILDFKSIDLYQYMTEFALTNYDEKKNII